MSVSEGYIDYLLDQLNGLGDIGVRKMFGGAGLYLNGVFFAIVADDLLYFKVDDSNLHDYLSAGMMKFHSLRYYEVPAEVVEDREALAEWAEKAVDVAVRKLAARKKKRRCGRE